MFETCLTEIDILKLAKTLIFVIIIKQSGNIIKMLFILVHYVFELI